MMQRSGAPAASTGLRAWTNSSLSSREPFTIVASTLIGSVSAFIVVLALSNPQGVKRWIKRKLFGIMRKVPAVDSFIQKSSEDVKKHISKSLNPYTNIQTFPQLPAKGLGNEEVLTLMKGLKEIEDKKWKGGKVSGAIYQETDELSEFLGKAYTMYSVTNPLHPDLFPSVKKFEAEVVTMTASLFKPVRKTQDGQRQVIHDGYEGICGAMTSGGTESIVMALKTYRDRARVLFPHITNPEIVAPKSAHAAFDKGCGYLGMTLVSVEVSEKDMKADIAKMRNAITENTILLVGSAPSFPHGTVDNIPELAKLADEFKIPLHVDACLGGFVLPFVRNYLDHPIPAFDFSLPAVTSISVDTHKYGQSPKGSSVILFRNADIRKYMYFTVVDWPGGLYASPSLAGSRSGALIASTWAALTSLGVNYYVQQAKDIVAACDFLKKEIAEIEGLEIIGKPDYPVVAFKSSRLNVLRINDEMTKLGWFLNALHKPTSVHLCVTARSAKAVNEFIRDLKKCVALVKQNPSSKEGMAPVYGLAESIPDTTLVSDFLVAFVDSMLDAPPATIHQNHKH